MQWLVGKNGSNNDRGQGVMSRCQQIRFVEILYSLRWYVEFVFAEPNTILVFKINFGVFGEGTRLAMPKKICAPDSIVIEAWFRGY